ncbi:MAG: carbohydrate ABC transporter permease [Anaerolineae bacterium]|nr:carbohydrate ABC transporter permease [Anaerolineae bacterium]
MTSLATYKPVSWYQRKSVRQTARKIIDYLLLILPSILFLIPFFWMLSTAFKPPKMVYLDPPVWIPNTPSLQNFIEGWNYVPWPKFYRNTILITLFSVIGSLGSSAMVGFAFASLNGRGKNFLFTLLLATMMVPGAVTLIPTFILFTKVFKWMDTYFPLIVPHFFASPFFVFLFRQFFRSIPRDLYDSAEIDGCSPFGIFTRIAVPLSGPIVATASLFLFLGSWNDLMGPLIYLASSEKFTVTLGLTAFTGLYFARLHLLMPMSIVAMLPSLVLFFLAQKYFVRGIVTTGLKF